MVAATANTRTKGQDDDAETILDESARNPWSGAACPDWRSFMVGEVLVQEALKVRSELGTLGKRIE